MSLQVTKRDGSVQPFDLEKIHKVLEWAIEGISGVSMSEIELKANIQLYDKIPAYDIHELLIKSANNGPQPESMDKKSALGGLIS